MPKARRKPKSPAQIAAERSLREAQARADAGNPETWGVSRDTAAQADVRVETETRSKAASARREDVFARLLPTQAATLAAVRRLEADVQARAGEGGCGGIRERVDVTSGLFDAVTVRSLDAGERVRAVLALVGRRDALLLGEMIAPVRIRTEAREGLWRVCVLQITGERGDKAQAAAVRSACENLRLAYAELDGRGRSAPVRPHSGDRRQAASQDQVCSPTSTTASSQELSAERAPGMTDASPGVPLMT